MRWRFLFSPGWMALTLGVVAFSVVCFTVLAPWQFHRAAERSDRNAGIEASYSTPSQPLRDLLPAGTAPGPNTEWRLVELTGRYLPDGEVVARLRTVQGEPAFEVLTPFRLSDGTVVLVNRGFVRPGSGGGIPDYAPAPTDQVTVQGRLRADEPRRDEQPVVGDDGIRQVYEINSHTVAEVTGHELSPGYVQLVADQPGVLYALPLPQLSSGPFFAYALQWIAFGVMAPLGLLYFGWREVTGGGQPAAPRMHPREALQDDTSETASPAAVSASSQRYGRRR